MDNLKLEKIIQSVSDSVSGQPGYWQFKFNEVWLTTITDEKHNRMRIVLPIARINELEDKHFYKALEANFHSVLDAKYAISDDIMWSIFVHPLKELSEGQVKDAISQVYYAAVTFGGDYISSELTFPKAK